MFLLSVLGWTPLPAGLPSLKAAGPQQPVDLSCHPWLLVGPDSDGSGVSHLLNAFSDVVCNSFCKFLDVGGVVCGCVLKHVPVCSFKAVLLCCFLTTSNSLETGLVTFTRGLYAGFSMTVR